MLSLKLIPIADLLCSIADTSTWSGFFLAGFKPDLPGWLRISSMRFVAADGRFESLVGGGSFLVGVSGEALETEDIFFLTGKYKSGT